MLKKYLDKIRPAFEDNGKLHCFRSVFEGFESFLYVPNTTAKSGTHIHDSIDSKRIMSIVVIALLPALLFGMYNVGWQNYAAAGKLAEATFFEIKRKAANIDMEILRQKAAVFLRATGEFKGYDIFYKGLSMDDM